MTPLEALKHIAEFSTDAFARAVANQALAHAKDKKTREIAMPQRQLIESTALDIIAAIREHGPTRDVIIPRLEELAAVFAQDAFYEGFYNGSQNLVSASFAWAGAKSRLQFVGSKK